MTETERLQIYTAATPTVTRIIPELATEIGLNESIMLLQLDFWISTSSNLQDGRWWTFQSVRDMKDKAFGYWSLATINRTVKSLEKMGYVVTGNYNTRKGDLTRWFALNYENLAKLKSIKILPVQSPEGVSKRNTAFQNETPPPQNETPFTQNETTLPETPTEKEEILASAEPDAPAPPAAEEPKPKRTRKPDPLFDAISETWKTTAGGYIGNMKAMFLGTAKKGEWQRCNFDLPATPEEIIGFGKWWKRTHPGLELTKPETIQRRFYEYRAEEKRKAARPKIVSMAAEADWHPPVDDYYDLTGNSPPPSKESA